MNRSPSETIVSRLAWPAITVAAIVLASACTEAPQEPTGLVVDELRRSRVASAVDAEGPLMVYPVALEWWRDSLAVADGNGAQIVVLPPSLDGGRAFGRRGEGPGELKGPHALAVSGDDLVVYDPGNLRATWFDPSSEYVRSQSLRIPRAPPGFAVLDDGLLVIPTASDQHYVEVISADGSSTPALERPGGAVPCRPQGPLTSNMVAGSPDAIFLVDTENGLTVRWSGDESPVVDSIPSVLLASGQGALDSIFAEAGEEVECLMPVMAAGASDEGLVLWVAGLSHPAGALLRPSGEWATIAIADCVRAEFPMNPWDVLLMRDELYVVTQDGIRVFGLSPVE